MLKILPSARKHGIADEDIEHAVNHAMAIDRRNNDTQLYLGPARSSELLEVATIIRLGHSQVAIHAMKMRSKYRSLSPGG